MKYNLRNIISLVACLFCFITTPVSAQINTDRVMTIGKNALYFEDYVLSIQYFNQVIKSKPHLAEPYFYRGVAKFYLDDYSGAELDLSSCLEKNPFIWSAYQYRGAARQSLGNYEGAIEDYDKGLGFRPEDRNLLFYKGLALAQDKNYEDAIATFEYLHRFHAKFIPAYLTEGAVYFEKGDTIQALEIFDKALEIDKYNATAYDRRAIVKMSLEDYEQALNDLNEAVRLDPKQPNYYVNRGLAKYYLNDLRGSMADYDLVIQMDKDNMVARFNRALLRSNVGDTEGAIDDLSAVLKIEPDNHIALYNRSVLNQEIGKYTDALNDLEQVLTEYPNFVQGYYFKSNIKRKMNDLKGAEKAYWEAHDLEEKLKKLAKQGVEFNGKGISGDNDDSSDDNKVRERSDKDINKFNRLVVADKDDNVKTQYQSEIRGRIQDRNVKVDVESQFVITYYQSLEAIERAISYSDKNIIDINNRQLLKLQLKIVNKEVALTDDQADYHFSSINDYSLALERNPENKIAYFARGLDYMLLQDFSEAIDNYTKAIDIDSKFLPAYFNRAVTRYKKLEVESQNQRSESSLEMTNNANIKDNPTVYSYDLIIRDYNTVIDLDPEFIYAYFNRANIKGIQKDYKAAIQDYTSAIDINPNFAEAWFNRGLVKLALGDVNSGILDLSKAGELGMINAYSIIKRMSAE